MGFALQIIENLEGIEMSTESKNMIDGVCASWVDYANAFDVFAASEWESGV